MPAFTYSPTVASWTPGTSKMRPTTTVGSDERQAVVSLNQMLYPLNNLLAALGGEEAPMTTATLSRGTTVTLAATASVISINAVSAVVAALTAQAFGALGTIPTAKWGLIKVQRVLAGTCTFVSAANNYTTGYDSEALAIAAMPATTADRVAIGYLTILAASPGWVAGTDALAGGTGGTPATTTNYYSFAGAVDTAAWTNALQIANPSGTVITTTAG
jgi:hypothetical protein